MGVNDKCWPKDEGLKSREVCGVVFVCKKKKNNRPNRNAIKLKTEREKEGSEREREIISCHNNDALYIIRLIFFFSMFLKRAVISCGF